MGGIVPKLAHHAHMRNLPSVVQEAIQRANLGEQGIQAIDLIAVTRGPGLAHSLGVGLNAAKTLAAALNKPLIGVHHMEAHALTARLTTQDPDHVSHYSSQERTPEPTSAASTTATITTSNPATTTRTASFALSSTQNDSNKTLIGSDPYPSFPFLTLLVSGGHTMLLIAHSVNRYTTLATTVDDSIGDAFDKTARELQIPWITGRAGGPGASLEEFAKRAKNPKRYLDQLPIPMSLRNNKREMKFSFAGLKAAVTRIVQQETEQAVLDGSAAGLRPDEIIFMDEDKRRDLAAGFQYCAVTHLGQKVAQGLDQCREQGLDISSLVISGGVGRNATVRSKMEQICDPEMTRPDQPQHQYQQHQPGQNQDKSSSSSSISKNKKKSKTDQKSKEPRRRVQVICPPPKLCTDNAVMIAWTGIERFKLGLVDPYDIDIVPKWPLDMLGTGTVPE
ncbi:hypothetical protein BGZ83_012178 [Gryganskiella cystojenkinii]|nr:hypothetical protein BGZ83_012178 [Gryganskiella cystojenkinii]